MSNRKNAVIAVVAVAVCLATFLVVRHHRNAARHATRSLLTVGLLASAAFLIVAVESFRRRVPASDGTPEAADGGFALVGESDLPLFRDPNSAAGRAELLTGLKAWLSEQGVRFTPGGIDEVAGKNDDVAGDDFWRVCVHAASLKAR